MDEISIEKSSVSFMTKKEFIDRKTSECFSVTEKAEKKLSGFDDNDILAIDVSVNSPATVVDINKGEKVIDFLHKRFTEEGVSLKDMNESFQRLN